jgi:hypothetical protein
MKFMPLESYQKMIQLECPDGQEKHSDGPASGPKVSASRCSLEFEKFQNSFSDTETTSNHLDALRLHPDAAQRTPNQNCKRSSKAYK